MPLPNGRNLTIQAGPALIADSTNRACVQSSIALDPLLDCHITVVDTTTGMEHDLFATHTADTTNGFLQPASGEVWAGGSGHLSIAGTGQDEGQGGGVAAGTGNLAGRIRLEEFQSAVAYENGQGGRPLGHALAITIPCIYPGLHKASSDTRRPSPTRAQLSARRHQRR